MITQIVDLESGVALHIVVGALKPRSALLPTWSSIAYSTHYHLLGATSLTQRSTTYSAPYFLVDTLSLTRNSSRLLNNELACSALYSPSP
ncbi:hypothetical protein VNO78_15742 [Psophocarpus tetragonolobus]|uniref:Uncharacterized protein n=1 Tax=Psophocarpus tetragonolobus TaxID=3891 RepID=A0AAN9SFI2_PSOTE